jgi:hypothetical protein
VELDRLDLPVGQHLHQRAACDLWTTEQKPCRYDAEAGDRGRNGALP